MSRLLRRFQQSINVFTTAIERLLSPEIFMADRRLAKKQVAVPVWRKRTSSLERLTGAWNRLGSGVHQGLALTFVLLLLTAAVHMPRQAYEVRLSDEQTGTYKVLGVMHSSESLSVWIEQILAKEPNPNNYDLFIYPSVSVQPVWRYSWEGPYTNPAVIKERLNTSVQVFTEASIIRVADKVSLPVADALAANQVLDNVQLHYVESKNVNTLKAYFAEAIYVERQRIDPAQIISIEDATNILLTGSETQKTLTVQFGDSLWDYAMAMASERSLDIDEALQQLSESNPQLDINGLTPGDTLFLPLESEPLLAVTVTETVEEYEDIPFEVEVRYSDAMYRYEDPQVERYGTPGKMLVQATVTRRNGSVIGRVKNSETIISEPVSQVILRGTKAADDRGNGDFIWPIQGRLSDRFGWRDLGYHRGQDISSGGVATVVAADAGVVTQAGWDSGGLGYCVTIDHRNGFVTRYGHFSEVLVSVGDGVKQGQGVGIEGNTGYSFGTHLHFEVLYYGSYMDPLDYLP